MAEKTLDLILAAHERGIEVMDAAAHLLSEIRDRVEETNAVLAQMDVELAATSAELGALNAALSDTLPALQGTSSAATAAAEASFSLGAVLPYVAAGAITLGVALAGALAPFLVELAASITILAGFTAGLAGAVSVMTLAAGAIAALGAGVLLLGNRTIAGQQALAGFTNHLGQLADHLAAVSEPLMGPILDLLTSMADQAAVVGDQLLGAFGARLPEVLSQARGILGDLFAALEQAAPVVSRFFDAFLQRGPGLNLIFQGMLSVGVGAINGLLTNLLRLSDWFTARLPTMGPIVSGIMGNIGSALQRVATDAGKVVDWFTANWHSITDAANQTWQAISAGWALVKPLLDSDARAVMETFNGLMKDAHTHSEALKGTLFALGVVLGLLATTVEGASIIFMGLLDTLIQVVTWIQAMATWVNTVTGGWEGLGRAAQGALDALGRVADVGLGLPGTGGLGRASGGPVNAGGVYTVGEHGPETLVMGPSGGYVIPGSGSGGDTNMDDTNELLSQAVSVLSAILARMGSAGFPVGAYTGR
jgi:hypothetical protein